jgi:hypothetical protein
VSTVVVNVENFVRAESDRTLASFQAEAGGVNRLMHRRAPTPIDDQTVIRMNRNLTVHFGGDDARPNLLPIAEAGTTPLGSTGRGPRRLVSVPLD